MVTQTQSITQTKSGKRSFNIVVKCDICGWTSKGGNTFNDELVINWAEHIVAWHESRGSEA